MTTQVGGRTVTESAAVPDVLGDGYVAVTLTVSDNGRPLPPATLVRRTAPSTTERAVLYVHGYVDYFFQTELADLFADRGAAFYAIDLHGYGRSLREGQVPFEMADIADYSAELDAALARIEADGHTAVTVVAHSTGGLIVPLWLADRSDPGPVDSVVLNSPFLAINASPLMRTTIGAGVDVLSRYRPDLVLPLPDPGLYGRSIHRSLDGEWDFDTVWKPLVGVPLRIGWLAAVRRAQARLRHNLGLVVPVLVMASRETFRGKAFSPQIFTGDAVLDADQICDRAPRLGHRVTIERIDGGMHDLFLSQAEPRAAAYATMGAWLDRYTG